MRYITIERGEVTERMASATTVDVTVKHQDGAESGFQIDGDLAVVLAEAAASQYGSAKIHAIKYLRAMYPMDLRSALRLVEWLANTFRPTP